ncbi:MAG: SH3 domain-containing protein [Microbacterium sp.]
MNPTVHSARILSLRALVATAVLALVAAALVVMSPSPARAADLPSSIADGGFIIGDAEFFDGGSLSAAQVQSFLSARVPTCRATTGPTCLASFRTTLPAKAADAYCQAIAGRADASAAEVIAAVGLACGISPKVILVMLEKEQGLVSSTAPSDWSYRAAMGQACPDTAPCSAAAAGFVNQVYLGARQMKVYTLNPNSFNYRAGQYNTIKWHPSSACGTSKVFIRNQATANLYNYTPYRPNLASLAAGYGLGDSCSTYGNRNFYNYYVRWFAPEASTSTGAPAQVAACAVPAEADIVPTSGTATVTAASLNARSAPTLACSDGISTLPQGRTVTVTATYSAWVRAVVDSRSVWLSKDYVTVSAPAPADAGCAVPAESAVTAASGTVIVIADRLNVRTAPSTSCTAGVTQLARGAVAERTGIYGAWMRVAVAGQQRWVHSDYVAVQAAPAPTPTPTPTPPPTPTPAPVTMQTTTALNLRASASISAQILTVIPQGASVSVTGADGAWRAVTVGSRSGWVHGDYLTTRSASEAPVVMVTTDALNLRASASGAAPVLTVLPKGTSVTVTGSDGVWRAVTAGTRTGWVHGDYLTTTAATTKTTTTGVNLRESDSTSSRILTVLSSGVRVSVLSSTDSWTRVSVGGRTGWIFSTYLR